MYPAEEQIRDLSIVIPTCNGGNRLLRVIETILQQECSYPFDIICVDSGTIEHQLHLMSGYPVRIHPLQNIPFDHGLTRDFGFSISRGDIVVLMTQDAVPVGKHWLTSLVEPLVANKAAAAAYSRQIPRPDASTRAKERLAAWYASNLEPRVQLMPSGRDFYSLGARDRLAIVAFDHVSCAVRRSVWKYIHHGPSAFGEDIAWSFKVLSAGYEIIYTPDSVVEHSHDPGIVELFSRTFKDHRNLREVLGAGFINSLPEAFVVSARGVLAEILEKTEEQDRTGPKDGRTRRAIESFVSAWAQYLGCRLAERTDVDAFRYARSVEGSVSLQALCPEKSETLKK